MNSNRISNLYDQLAYLKKKLASLDPDDDITHRALHQYILEEIGYIELELFKNEQKEYIKSISSENCISRRTHEFRH